jgi:hypothetical protein
VALVTNPKAAPNPVRYRLSRRVLEHFRRSREIDQEHHSTQHEFGSWLSSAVGHLGPSGALVFCIASALLTLVLVLAFSVHR